MLESAIKLIKKLPFANLFLSSEWVLRRKLKMGGAKIPPQKPDSCWLNTTLKTEFEVQKAIEELHRCGLPLHIDPLKNWDAVSALHFILSQTDKDAAILEMGAPPYAVSLPWLYLFGYHNLIGIDLVYEEDIFRGPIHYQRGDLTATGFDNQSFNIIICLSVIEHGVNLESYFKEVSRLLKPGGYLITSTDYWEEPIDTKGQIAFGSVIKIFCQKEIEDLLKIAEKYSLFLTSNLDLSCQQKAVHWKKYDLRYTFILFVLKKKAM